MNFNINPEQINQLLNRVPYPIGKDQLVDLARQHNIDGQVVGWLERLPDKTYHNAQEVQNDLGSLGNIGGLTGFKF